MLRIGNAQGFWGDSPTAPARLVQQQPDLDYLTLDYLAEVSMSIMAAQREKDPSLGYARDFIEVIKSLIPCWQRGAKVKIITNAGGLNPMACAQACQHVLKQMHVSLVIGVVSGDDVLSILKSHSKESLFSNLESGEPLDNIVSKLTTANAYLGAKPLVDALQMGSDIVITGRVTDPSLAVAPCMAHFGWGWDDYHKIAAATVAGHLIECGTQVSGGISTNWLEMPDKVHIGFPFVEVNEDGSFVITKPSQTGGRVTLETVKEQLLYEIGDPERYMSPDVIVSFLSLMLEEVGLDRIRVTGAKGAPPTNTYKVSATYRDGFKTEAMLALYGENAAIKAKLCGEIILERTREAGYNIKRFSIECLGAGGLVPHAMSQSSTANECVLRVAVADDHQEALECFAREVAPLVTSGPPGVTGYTSGRPHVRPVFGYWPCLVEKEQVVPSVQLLRG